MIQEKWNEKKWKAVRQFYMDSFGIAPELVDLMASNEILLMSVSGASNKSISRILNIDETSIGEILLTVFDFAGWKEDLFFSPYRLYEIDRSLVGFIVLVKDTNELSNLTNIGIEDIEIMYNMCSIYSEIESRLDTDWI